MKILDAAETRKFRKEVRAKLDITEEEEKELWEEGAEIVIPTPYIRIGQKARKKQ